MLLLPKAFLDKTIADSFPDQFALALEYLKPILVTDGEKVLYMHPSILTALIENGLDRIVDCEEDVVSVLKLSDMIPSMTSADIYRSKESRYFRDKGYFPDMIVQALKTAVAQISLVRVLERQPELISTSTIQPEPSLESPCPEGEKPVGSKRPYHYSSVDIVDVDQEDLFRQLREENRRLKEKEKDSQ